MFERFTEKAIKVIMLAQEEARRLGHNFVGTEQILLGLVGEGTGIAARAMKSSGVNLKDARVVVEKIIGRGTGFVAVEIPFTPNAKKILELSWAEAKQLGHNYIGTEHLLLGILQFGESSRAWQVLRNLGADPKELRAGVCQRIAESGAVQSTPAQPSGVTLVTTPTLDEFGVTLTSLEEDKLDPLVGRDLELTRMLRILSRREKNNPLIVGERGAGKSALVKGLANLLAKKDAPESLRNRRIVLLDVLYLSVFTNGVNLLKNCFSEAEAHRVILVLDEMQLSLGKPQVDLLRLDSFRNRFLANSAVSCIGITSLCEYESASDQDETYKEYFEPIFLAASTVEESVAILNGKVKKLEAYYKVSVSAEAIEQAVNMSDQLNLPDLVLPGKAVQVLDEACSMIRLRRDTAHSYSRDIYKVCREKEMAIRNQEFEKAASLSEEESRLSEAIRESAKSLQVPEVSGAEVAEVVGQWRSAYTDISAGT